jgi:hypothetical protein
MYISRNGALPALPETEQIPAVETDTKACEEPTRLLPRLTLAEIVTKSLRKQRDLIADDRMPIRKALLALFESVSGLSLPARLNTGFLSLYELAHDPHADRQTLISVLLAAYDFVCFHFRLHNEHTLLAIRETRLVIRQFA